MILSVLGIFETIVHNVKSPDMTKRKRISNKTRLLKPIKIGYNQ